VTPKSDKSKNDRKTSKKELLFVNKKKQKNFDSHGVPLTVPAPREAEQKFFGSCVPMTKRPLGRVV
jgi:hypothetical protein